MAAQLAAAAEGYRQCGTGKTGPLDLPGGDLLYIVILNVFLLYICVRTGSFNYCAVVAFAEAVLSLHRSFATPPEKKC